MPPTPIPASVASLDGESDLTTPVQYATGALERADWLAGAAVTLVAAALFVSTFSAHVALGDAPESVSGVKTVGVLHAPGYPSYVAAASAFSKVAAFGGLSARVNAFSLLCAALMIGAVYLLARSFGAGRLGSVLGAFMLATSASFWFNADFAKHYSFSGLLVTVAALAVSIWNGGGGRSWLVFAGLALGACAGASWELAVIMTAGLAVLVVFGSRRAGALLIGATLAALALVTIASYAFLVWRARQHPAVNWGEVTNLNRLVPQITQRDFRGGAAQEPSQHNLALKTVTRAVNYVGGIERDLGFGGFVLALFGAVLGVRHLDRGRKLFLAVTAVLNLFAVVFVAGFEHIAGFITAIVAGGYLIDLLVVLAVLAALGLTPLIEQAALLVHRGVTPARLRSRTTDASRFHTRLTWAACVIVLVPSLAFHYEHANHRIPPLADRFASRIFAELPEHAVLFVYQGDVTFPLIYRQTVLHGRPDVNVIATSNLQLGWYREQIGRDLHLRSPVRGGVPLDVASRLIAELRPTRPVFIDVGMKMFVRTRIPTRQTGMVAKAVDRGSEAIDTDALARELLSDDRADGFAGHPYARFPNLFICYMYSRAHIELAKLYAASNRLERAQEELGRALDVYADDGPTRQVLRFSKQKGEDRAKVVEIIRLL